ncbi:MAG: transglutaminase N-terminal domain-containing protein, partial [Pseudomonadota bacterium]
MRYTVRHVTSYRYAQQAAFSQHLLRLTPRATDDQRVLASTIEISPRAEPMSEAVDMFGNTEHVATVTRPHDELTITATSTVERSAPGEFMTEAGAPWEAVRDQALGLANAPPMATVAPFAFPSAMTAADAAIEVYARESLAPGRPYLAAAVELCARIYEDFDYSPGATGADTLPGVSFAARHGVCQDFAHVMLACLRASPAGALCFGLPAHDPAGGAGAAAGRRCQPRLGIGLGSGVLLGRFRSHQRRGAGARPHHPGLGPGFSRREPGLGPGGGRRAAGAVGRRRCAAADCRARMSPRDAGEGEGAALAAGWLWAALFAVGLSWGLTQFFMKPAMASGVHPIGAAFWQASVGAVVAGTALWLSGRRLPLSRHHIAFYGVCGILGTALPAAVSFEAIQHLPVGVQSLVISMVPILTVAMALAFRIERAEGRRIGGVVLGFSAIALIVGPDTSLPDPALTVTAASDSVGQSSR